MSTIALDLDAVEAAARHLGDTLPSGAIVWLEGPLGAGKTTFARALLAGRGLPDVANSPTYALVHHYPGPRGPVYHLDCFRLRDPEEAADLDWETLSAADLLLIEWPERAGAWAPAPTHRILLEPVDETTRTLKVET